MVGNLNQQGMPKGIPIFIQEKTLGNTEKYWNQPIFASMLNDEEVDSTSGPKEKPDGEAKEVNHLRNVDDRTVSRHARRACQ